jgi:hypothetical protein
MFQGKPLSFGPNLKQRQIGRVIYIDGSFGDGGGRLADPRPVILVQVPRLNPVRLDFRLGWRPILLRRPARFEEAERARSRPQVMAILPVIAGPDPEKGQARAKSRPIPDRHSGTIRFPGSRRRDPTRFPEIAEKRGCSTEVPPGSEESDHKQGKSPEAI